MTKRQELIDFMVWMGLDRDLAIVEADKYLADHPKSDTERSCRSCKYSSKFGDSNMCEYCMNFCNWKPQI